MEQTNSLDTNIQLVSAGSNLRNTIELFAKTILTNNNLKKINYDTFI